MMNLRLLIFSLVALLAISSCRTQENASGSKPITNDISLLQMNLSAYGVESDNYPSIMCTIDFAHDSSRCDRSYYSSKHHPTTYRLSHSELQKIRELLDSTNLTTLETEFTTEKSDQPTSTTRIYTRNRTFVIKDYGLVAGHPLDVLYKLVYKLGLGSDSALMGRD